MKSKGEVLLLGFLSNVFFYLFLIIIPFLFFLLYVALKKIGNPLIVSEIALFMLFFYVVYKEFKDYIKIKRVKNPFIAGSVVHHGQFFGREEIVQRLFNLWEGFPNMPMQNAAIYGEKRIGKTSLLLHLKDLAETDKNDPRWRQGQKLDYLRNIQRYNFIYVSFQTIEYQTQQGLLQYILDNMPLNNSDIDLSLPKERPLIKFRQIVIEYLTEPTVVLLDELSVAVRKYGEEFNFNFWEGLRAFVAADLNPQILAFVISAHESPTKLGQEIAEDGSPFFNIFGFTHKLEIFTESEALALINSSPKKFDEEDKKYILERSEKKPQLLQTLCRIRLEYLLRDDHSQAWKDEGLKQITEQQQKDKEYF